MGRITIFSMDDCPHCLRIKAAFTERNIPYLEISLTKYPNKRNAMLSLADLLTVPQVFLNQTHMGGAEATLKVLQTWDNDRALTPYQYYESFVAKSPDPKDPRLQPSTEAPLVEQPDTAPPRDDLDIQLPGNNFFSVLEITELLKSIVPCTSLTYNLTAYKSSFRADQAVDALCKQFHLTRVEAVEFGRCLQHHQIMDHVVGDHAFSDTHGLYFRLQCYQTPNVLNSYRIWRERVDPDSMALLRRLTKQLNHILAACTDPSKGQVDFKEAGVHTDFPAFEEAVCELQGVDYFGMPYDNKLVRSCVTHHGDGWLVQVR
jgi:glutaredoxin 3